VRLAPPAWPLAAALAVGAAAPVPAYRGTIEAWRTEREQKLRAEDGWLAVAGLFWLHEGDQRLGTAAGSDIVLPAGSAPAQAGTLSLHERRVTFRPEAGEPRVLRPDSDDAVTVGRLRLGIIERSGRLGLRVRDPESPRRRSFAGLRWYPVDEAYRVTARFVPAAAKRTIPIPNVLGDVIEMPSPGHVEFTLRGQALRLDPVLEDDAPELFFIFRDATAGKETYPAGRFLYADPPKDGALTLDFNQAYSPPCAFTDFATCPLPPPQNRLKLAIAAGEKRPPGH
jgi:uncharacterized protein (DUF1684 family)